MTTKKNHFHSGQIGRNVENQYSRWKFSSSCVLWPSSVPKLASKTLVISSLGSGDDGVNDFFYWFFDNIYTDRVLWVTGTKRWKSWRKDFTFICEKKLAQMRENLNEQIITTKRTGVLILAYTRTWHTSYVPSIMRTRYIVVCGAKYANFVRLFKFTPHNCHRLRQLFAYFALKDMCQLTCQLSSRILADICMPN